MKILTINFLTLLLLSPIGEAKDKKVTISISLIDDFADKSHNGTAFLLLDALLGKNNYIAEVTPLKRSVINFIKKKTDCFLGANSKQFKKNYLLETINSVPFSISTLHVWSLKSKEKAKSLKVLNGKTLLVYRGAKQIVVLKKNKIKYDKVIYYDRISQGIKLLESGKADFMTLWDHRQNDTLTDKAHFSEEITLTAEDARLVCYKSDRANKAIEIFNKNIKTNQELINKHFK